MILEHIDLGGRKFGLLALLLDVLSFGFIFSLLVARDMGQPLHSSHALLFEQSCIFTTLAALAIGLVGLFADKQRGTAVVSVVAPFALFLLFSIGY
jgi:hypothetical protein